ncbi:hypothetical protein GFS31_33050 [Leptolyngbya sp. BL0902]|nr:hypothetical protein GFS31_33050 [Leptolyngbya sp. BL0902]
MAQAGRPYSVGQGLPWVYSILDALHPRCALSIPFSGAVASFYPLLWPQ